MKKQTILLLGVTGMLGHVLFKEGSKTDNLSVYGTVRDNTNLQEYFSVDEIQNIYTGIDVFDLEKLKLLLSKIKPDIVVNCIGIIKQLPEAEDSISSIGINALFPHKLAKLCEQIDTKVIHISTDCVFNGKKGNYTEEDISNAEDLYGCTKYLGELNYLNSLTLRTSIIGHELHSHVSLIDWFLSQNGTIQGYTKAIFSGVTTLELTNIILKLITENYNLYGLYHISSEAISKYELLKIVAETYEKEIEIIPYDGFVLDRSLDSTKFQQASGYIMPSWDIMIESMYSYFVKSKFYNKKYLNVQK